MRLVDSASCLLATRVALLALVQIQYHNHTVCQVQWVENFSQIACLICMKKYTYQTTWVIIFGNLSPVKSLDINEIINRASYLLGPQVALLALVQIQYLNKHSHLHARTCILTKSLI